MHFDSRQGLHLHLERLTSAFCNSNQLVNDQLKIIDKTSCGWRITKVCRLIFGNIFRAVSRGKYDPWHAYRLNHVSSQLVHFINSHRTLLTSETTERVIRLFEAMENKGSKYADTLAENWKKAENALPEVRPTIISPGVSLSSRHISGSCKEEGLDPFISLFGDQVLASAEDANASVTLNLVAVNLSNKQHLSSIYENHASCIPHIREHRTCTKEGIATVFSLFKNRVKGWDKKESIVHVEMTASRI